MPTTPTFSAQLLGQTEKAANAILDRLLAEPRLSEPQWVTLSITAASGGTLGRGQLIERVAGALKVSVADAQARITELATRALLHDPGDDHAPITLTDRGQRVHGRVRAAECLRPGTCVPKAQAAIAIELCLAQPATIARSALD